MNKALFTIIYIAFLVHSIFNLERQIFITELFSIVGLIYCARFYFKNIRSLHITIEDPVQKTILIFIIYNFILIVYSILLTDVGLYAFLRTSTLFYSVFVFFVGYYCHYYVGKQLKLFGILLIPFFSFSGERLSLALSYYAINGVSKWICIIILAVSLGINAIFLDTSTPLLTLIVASAFLLLPQIRFLLVKSSPVLIMALVLLLITVFYFIFSPKFDVFNYVGYEVFGTSIDKNSYWRFMFWTYIIESNLNQYFFTGIGYGTKLFDVNNPELAWMVDTNHILKNPYIEYVLGPHNSLIFVFKRTGLIGLLIFTLYLFSIFQLAFRYKQYGVICALVLLNITMLLNVILESPIWSINYWFVSGACYGLLRRAKFREA